MNTKLLSNKIFIDWKPVTDSGLVTFHINSFVFEGDKATDFVNSEQEKVISKPINVLCEQVVSASESDPVTGASLENISGAGIMLLIKRLTDTVIAELEPQPDE